MLTMDFGSFKIDGSWQLSDYELIQIVNPDGDLVLGTAAAAQFKISLMNVQQRLAAYRFKNGELLTFKNKTNYGFSLTQYLPDITGKQFTLYETKTDLALYTFKNGEALAFKNNNMYGFPVDTTAQLGIFIAEKPVRKNDNIISITAYDRMTLFDVIVDDWINRLSSPITLLEMLQDLCAHLGVQLTNSSILNGSFIIKQKPKLQGITGRDIIRWIAEISACFAVMDEYGRLVLKWYSPTNKTISHDEYIKINIADYSVRPIDKLQVRQSENDTGVIIGTGSNVYIIKNNPLLAGSSNTEVQPLSQNIFNRIKDFAYVPYNSNGVNYGIKSGDIVNIETRKGQKITSPVMQTTKRRTDISDIKATGNMLRSVSVDVVERQFQQTENEIDKVKDEVSETKDDLTGQINEEIQQP